MNVPNFTSISYCRNSEYCPSVLLELYRDKICVYDEDLLAGRDIQYRAPDSQSSCTTPFDDIKLITYYLPVFNLLRIQQFPVNTTYKNFIDIQSQVNI